MASRGKNFEIGHFLKNWKNSNFCKFANFSYDDINYDVDPCFNWCVKGWIEYHNGRFRVTCHKGIVVGVTGSKWHGATVVPWGFWKPLWGRRNQREVATSRCQEPRKIHFGTPPPSSLNDWQVGGANMQSRLLIISNLLWPPIILSEGQESVCTREMGAGWGPIIHSFSINIPHGQSSIVGLEY